MGVRRSRPWWRVTGRVRQALAASRSRHRTHYPCGDGGGGADPAPGLAVDVPADLTVDPVPPDPTDATPATDRLLARLDEGVGDRVASRLQGDDAALWEMSAPHTRRQLTLAFGLHYGVEEIAARTGLTAAEPPETVHAMSRGSTSRGGSYYEADYVVDSLRGPGTQPGPGTRWLDFGSSSGRVTRVLAAAWPDAEWYGCDPNADAIGWAQTAFPTVSFAVSPQEPPLPCPDHHFDAAFAISIWSHFGPGAAVRWLSEMHRIVRPEGCLLLTTHGLSSVTFYARLGLRPLWQLQDVARALDCIGHWYTPEFGEMGDHGIVSDEWGTAFLTPTWLATQTQDQWMLLAVHPARNAGNQDVVVLRRI